MEVRKVSRWGRRWLREQKEERRVFASENTGGESTGEMGEDEESQVEENLHGGDG